MLLNCYLETLSCTNRNPVKHAETKTPVDDVGPVVELPLDLRLLHDGGVVRNAELLQPGQVRQVRDVPQLRDIVVTQGQCADG